MPKPQTMQATKVAPFPINRNGAACLVAGGHEGSGVGSNETVRQWESTRDKADGRMGRLAGNGTPSAHPGNPHAKPGGTTSVRLQPYGQTATTCGGRDRPPVPSACGRQRSAGMVSSIPETDAERDVSPRFPSPAFLRYRRQSGRCCTEQPADNLRRGQGSVHIRSYEGGVG